MRLSMGKYIFGITCADVTITEEGGKTDASYPATNLNIPSSLVRHWRSNTIASDITINIYLAVPQPVDAIVLNDFNFTDFDVEFTSGAIAELTEFNTLNLDKNDLTQRRSVYCKLNHNDIAPSWDVDVIRIYIRTGSAHVPIDGLSVWRLSSIVVPSLSVELKRNPGVGETEESQEADPIIQRNASGGAEFIRQGDNLIWQREISWNGVTALELPDILALNQVKRDNIIVFYENNGDASKVYLCRRENKIRIKKDGSNSVSVETIRLVEVI